MLECQWKSTFGVECLGCGFQRALYMLLDGDFKESFLMYPALIPFLATIFYTVAHINFGFNKGARNIIILFSLTAILILANYVYKLI